MNDISEQAGGLDYSLWTREEMDLLAAAMVDRIADDGFDESEGVGEPSSATP